MVHGDCYVIITIYLHETPVSQRLENASLCKGPFTPTVSNMSAIVTATSLRLKGNTSALFSYTKCQLCDDAPEWGCNPFSSVSIDFNENRIASIIAELLQR